MSEKKPKSFGTDMHIGKRFHETSVPELDFNLKELLEQAKTATEDLRKTLDTFTREFENSMPFYHQGLNPNPTWILDNLHLLQEKLVSAESVKQQLSLLFEKERELRELLVQKAICSKWLDNEPTPCPINTYKKCLETNKPCKKARLIIYLEDVEGEFEGLKEALK